MPDVHPELVIGRGVGRDSPCRGNALDGVADQRFHLRNDGCKRGAIIGVAGQRLHMGDEQPALGVR